MISNVDKEEVINKDEVDEEDDWEDQASFMEDEDSEEEVKTEKIGKKKAAKLERAKLRMEQESLTNMMDGLKFSDEPVIYEPPQNPKNKKNKKKDNEFKAFTGSNKTLAKGETLEFDNRAYEMFHRATTEW